MFARNRRITVPRERGEGASLRLSSLTAACMLLVFFACTRDNSKRLLARWASAQPSKQGISNMVQFRSDGSFTSAWEATQEFSYRLEGAQLFLVAQGPVGGPAGDQTFETRLDGDTLVLKTLLDGAETRLERVARGRSSASPLAGKWRVVSGGSPLDLYDFTDDGKLQLTQALKSQEGRYTVQGDSLTLDFEGAPSQTGHFRFENDQLVLSPTQGAQQRFKKED